MSVNIPLGFSTGATTAPGGINIPLGIGLVQGAATTSRETQVVRAVAAAAAVADPAGAVEFARLARENPAAVVAPQLDRALLDPVLAAVERRFVEKAGAPDPTALHSAVRAAVGADAKLVAAAHQAIVGNPNAAAEALGWVASIEPQLLEKAGLAAARRTGLDLVPGRAPAPATEIEQIKARLDAVEKQLPQQPAPQPQAYQPQQAQQAQQQPHQYQQAQQAPELGEVQQAIESHQSQYAEGEQGQQTQQGKGSKSR